VKPTECAKLNSCGKIAILLDKDLLWFQYVELAEIICSKCKEAEPKNKVASVPSVKE